MAKKEIDEAEYNSLVSGLALLQKLNGNPEARAHLERSMKVLNPKLETEEEAAARVAAPYVAQINETKQTVADLQKRLDDAESARVAAQDAAEVTRQNKWLDEQDYTEEGKAAIKKLMTDQSIPNAEAAAALWEKRNPKPVQIQGANYESDSWNLRGDEKDENLKQLFANPDAWADKEAALTLNTIRRDAANAQAA